MASPPLPPPDRHARADLSDFARFIRRISHALARHPDLLAGRAADEPDDSPPARRAHAYAHRRPWLSWLDKPQHPHPRLLRIVCESAPSKVRLAADGSLALSLHADGWLRTWDLATGTELARWETPALAPTAIALLGPTCWVAHQGGVEQYDARSGQWLAAGCSAQGEVVEIAVSEAEAFVLIDAGGEYILLRLADGEVCFRAPGENRRGVVRVSLQPLRLLVAKTNTLSVWEPSAGWRDFTEYCDPGGDVWSGWTLARGGRWALWERTTRISGPVMYDLQDVTVLELLDVVTGSRVRSTGARWPLLGACESRGLVAAGGTGNLVLLDVGNLGMVCQVDTGASSDEVLDFSAAGDVLLTAGPEGFDLWDVEALLRQTAAGPRLGAEIMRPKQCRVANPGERFLISGESGYEYCHQVVDFAGRRRALRGSPVHVEEPSVISPDGSTVALMWSSDELTAWRVESGGWDQIWRRSVAGSVPQQLAIDDEGRRLATLGNFGEVRILELLDGREIAALQVVPGSPRAVAFLRGGSWLLAQTGDRTCLWDLASGRAVGMLPEPTWWPSADGRWLAAVERTDVAVYRLDSSGIRLHALLSGKAPAVTATFLRDPDLLLCTRQSGEVERWRIVSPSGQVEARNAMPERPAQGAVVSPDESAVITYSSKLLCLWTLPRLQLVSKYWIDEGEIWQVGWPRRQRVVVVLTRDGRLYRLAVPVLAAAG